MATNEAIAARRAARRAAQAALEAREVWTCLRRRGAHGRINCLSFDTRAEAEADAAYWSRLGHWTKVIQGPGVL